MNSSSEALPRISVLVTNWHSTSFLKDLIPNLRDKAAQPDGLTFVVVDNTNGADVDLVPALEQLGVAPPILHQPNKTNGSEAHASALARGFQEITSPYTLVLDPDVHLIQSGWDETLIDLLDTESVVATGAAYPAWKLGKYHDFPSPIFCFSRTESLRALGADWTPFYPSLWQRWGAKIGRQVVRLGALNTRQRCIKYPFLLRLGRSLENCLGVVGPDTGQRLARNARKQHLKSKCFSDVFPTSPLLDADDHSPFRDIAETFELYALGDTFFMIHMGGTKHYMFHTERGYDRAYWNECLGKLSAVSPQNTA